MDELSTYVLYDIPDDGIRTKIADICKDYGLQRIQFSAFCGPLTRNMREELFLRLGDTLGGLPGKILLQPVCEKDNRSRLLVENEDVEPECESPAADAASERPEAV
ncbi:MAG: CRISPR-associated endonuclease Cas2 [Nitrospiraceae bacterium]